MTGFTVDPDTFGPVASQLRQAASSLEQQWQPVMSQSQSLQFGRGDDVLSPLIQVSIEGAVSLVDSCVKSSAGALGDYADGLDRMASTYRGTETDTTSMLRPAE